MSINKGTMIVSFGQRTKLVKFVIGLDDSLFSSLNAAVLKILQTDTKLKSYASKPYFLRYVLVNSTNIMEFDENTEMSDIDASFAMEFVLEENVDLTIATAGSASLQRGQHPSPAAVNQNTRPAEQQQVSDSDAEYLKSIGFDSSLPDDNVSKPTTANKKSVTNQSSGNQNVVAAVASTSTGKAANKENVPVNASKKPARKRKAPSKAVDSDDEISPYEQKILLQRKENSDFLISSKVINLKESIPKNKKKRSKTPANKIPTTVEIRVMPTRKAKERKIQEEEEEEDEFDSDAQVDELIAPAGSESGEVASPNRPSLLTSDTPVVKKTFKRVPVKRWSQKKPPPLVGKAISKNVPLSPLPIDFEEEIMNGILDIRKVNKFLLAHCKRNTNRRPVRGEYAIMAEQFVQKMETLGVINASSYMNRIRLSVSSSNRANKRYPDKIKPQRLAKKLNKQKNIVTLEIDINAQTSQEPEDRSDAILRRTVANKDTVKHAISISITRLEFFATHTVHEIMKTYPYLNHCDLLIYEYSTRIPSTVQLLQNNFEESLVPLAQILGKDDPGYELLKLQLFQEIETYFADEGNVESERGICPALQIWDTSVKVLRPLNNLPKGQSPGIVVLKSSDSIQSVSVTFDGEKLATHSEPSAFECISLLVGAYFVFNCGYPSGYENFLLVTEAILHGAVESALRKCKSNYRRLEFLQKLSTALLVKKSGVVAAS